MIEQAKFSYLYKTIFFRLIRTAIFLFLLSFTLVEFLNGYTLKIFISLLILFLISEAFFRFKITKAKPKKILDLNDGKNIYDSFTLVVLEVCLEENVKNLIKNLIKKPQIKFMLQKADLEEKEISLVDISKEELSISAFNTAKSIKGKYVTTMDIFAAYILLIESQTKLLFSKKLKTEEFLHILTWARFDYSLEENPQKFRVNFWGEGVGENWVSGWMLETRKYTVDITVKVLNKNPILVGRNNEYKTAIETLCKMEKNNVLLVGEPGTGKTTLIEYLALQSYVDTLPANLYHKRFYELMLGPLLAGVNNQGDLEGRLEAIISEIYHTKNVVLYIPEFQNIVGASSFHLDLSGAFYPYLRDGKIPIIATSTFGNYKTYIEPLKNLINFFEVIKLEEPDRNLAIEMLLEKASSIERKNEVFLTYHAIIAAIEHSKQYIQDRSLPGTAVVLLENAANKVSLIGRKKVEEEDVLNIIEEKTKIAVGLPKAEEKELLLNLEKRIHERIIDQEEAVDVIAEAMRRIRTGLASSDKPISFLFLGPTGVGKTETAKALSSIYFKGEDKMIRLDMSEYTTENGVNRLLGSSAGGNLFNGGELTEKVYEHPFSLVLLDEFEKANPKILDLFLQVLDDGRLTDNKGKTVSFVNTVIIATSNAASEFIREEIGKGTIVDKQFQQKLLDFLQTKELFKPELLNRFDAVVVFKPLGVEEVREVTKLMLNKVSKKLLEQDITFIFDEKIIAKIITGGFNQEFGARSIRRFIQDNIEDLIAQKILKDEIKRGNKVNFSTDDANNITLTVF